MDRSEEGNTLSETDRATEAKNDDKDYDPDRLQQYPNVHHRDKDTEGIFQVAVGAFGSPVRLWVIG